METVFREEIGDLWLGWFMKDLEHEQGKGYGGWVSMRDQTGQESTDPRGNWDVGEACGAS